MGGVHLPGISLALLLALAGAAPAQAAPPLTVLAYENPASISRKAAFATTYRLAGVSVWALGLEDASFWRAIPSAGR